MTCADCHKTLTYRGRGRPPLRCAPCQATHRRETVTRQQRARRANAKQASRDHAYLTPRLP